MPMFRHQKPKGSALSLSMDWIVLALGLIALGAGAAALIFDGGAAALALPGSGEAATDIALQAAN
ncbi:MAG: hypothetical protein AAFM92_00735 [Pseudomonadota bacterium]